MNQNDVARHVDDIHDQRHGEWRHRVLHAAKETEQGERHQHRGRGENAHVDIGRSSSLHFRRPARQPQAELRNRRAKSNDQHTEQQSEQQRLPHRAPRPNVIPRPVRLRNNGRRPRP